MIIMFSGMIAVIIKGIYDVNGIDVMWSLNENGGRLNFFDFDPNPLVRQSFWSLVIGGNDKLIEAFDIEFIKNYKSILCHI